MRVACSRSEANDSFQAHPHQNKWRHKMTDRDPWDKVASKRKGMVRESISNNIFLSFNVENMKINAKLKADLNGHKYDRIVDG